MPQDRAGPHTGLRLAPPGAGQPRASSTPRLRVGISKNVSFSGPAAPQSLLLSLVPGRGWRGSADSPGSVQTAHRLTCVLSVQNTVWPSPPPSPPLFTLHSWTLYPYAVTPSALGSRPLRLLPSPTVGSSERLGYMTSLLSVFLGPGCFRQLCPQASPVLQKFLLDFIWLYIDFLFNVLPFLCLWIIIQLAVVYFRIKHATQPSVFCCDLLILKLFHVRAHVRDCRDVPIRGQIFMKLFWSHKSSCEVSHFSSLFPKTVHIRLLWFLPQHLEEFTPTANWIWTFCGNIFSRTIWT